ncbi:MAG: SGNH/GDSL hydrolase family protein [Amphritea sp.]|nr:SGNH/GDSL hydrolase family protein [Amphritea sp.]
MQQILVYSDSLSWGIIPATRKRLAFDQRWPGVMENQLTDSGHQIRVIENCLNGRRTVWDDPFKDGRNGHEGLSQVIEMNSPLSLVILMLGTNDFQCTHQNNAWLSAQGTARLIQTIRQAPIEPGMPIPSVLVVAPPAIIEPKGAIAHKFAGAEKQSGELVAALQQICEEHKARFFDANTVTDASKVDGIHLDAPQHLKLGQAIAELVEQKYL